MEGEAWYHQIHSIRIPVTLIALLLTIVLMFSLKRDLIVRSPWMCVLQPSLFCHHVPGQLCRRKKLGADCHQCLHRIYRWVIILNWPLPITIGVFGINSGQAFAGVISPLVEVLPCHFGQCGILDPKTFLPACTTFKLNLLK
jgi:ACR3 family arsenite transporter